MVTSLYIISLVILVTFLILTGIDNAARFINNKKKKNYTETLPTAMVVNE